MAAVNTHTVIGHTKRFECRVIGHPRPEIRWFKDGRDITLNSRYHFDHTYEGIISMIIENIHPNDQGNYRCRAENTEGFASTSAYLIVKPHKEHPDEEIEEVHCMQLEEHFVYKTDKDITIMTDPIPTEETDLDSRKMRTFEQLVDKEKENTREIMNGTSSKEFSSSSSKKSSKSSSLITEEEEESYSSKKTKRGYYEEITESSSSSSRKTKTSAMDDSSYGEVGVVSSQEERSHLSSSSSSSKSKLSASATEESVSFSSKRTQEENSLSISGESTEETSVQAKKKMTVSEEIESETSSAKKTQEKKSLSVSASVEETKVKSKTESSADKEMVIGVSVETEESASSSKSKKETKGVLKTTTATEESEKSQDLKLSVETSEGETVSKVTEDAAKATGLVTSVETDEESRKAKASQEKSKLKLSVETSEEETRSKSSKEAAEAKDLVTSVETTSSKKKQEESRKLVVDVEVEDVPEECRLEIQGQDNTDGKPEDLTHSAMTSLNDSGFMESSLLESILTEETGADSAKLSVQKDATSKAEALKQASRVDESTISDSSRTTSAAESAETAKAKEVKDSSLADSAEVSQEKSLVKEETLDVSAEATKLSTAAEQQAKAEEVSASKTEKTSISQETSRADETTSLGKEETADMLAEASTLAKTAEQAKVEETSKARTEKTSVSQETSQAEETTSLVKEETAEVSADTTKLADTAEQATVAETPVSSTEKTSVSQDTSRVDETTEKTSTGDITGLLDEKPSPETVVDAVVEAELEDGEQRSRWVDQIASKTDKLTIEGEGYKVDELKDAKVEAATTTEKKEDQVDLGTAKTEEPSEAVVDAEKLIARQTSLINELPVEEGAVGKQETIRKDKRTHEEKLAVDEHISAQNTLGLERAPVQDLDSSVDAVKETDADRDLTVKADVDVEETKKTAEADKDKGLTVTADVDVEETKKTAEADKDKGLTVTADVEVEETNKSGKDDDEMKMTAETSVSDTEKKREGLSGPTIVSAPEDVSVELGQVIRLVSQVQGNPQPEVKWFKEGDTVKPGDRVTLQTEDDVFTLEINDTTSSDGGTYTLTAHNSEGTIFSDVLVTVSVPPSVGPADDEIRITARLSVPEFVVQPGKVTVKELGTLELVCTIKASPSPTVVWSKEGKTLQSDSHISIFESDGQYYLKIPKASAEDGGDYTCTATNSEGSVTCTIAVFVESQQAGTSPTEEGAAALVPLSQLESSSDVSTVDSATTRYLKLVAAAAAFSLAAFGVKKVVETLHK